MKTIAIITARGGSKRIPNKNIKLFLGKPIIEYSIETALQSGIFDEVMVSTDDEEIAQISRAAGASIPFYRSSESSGDFATTSDVILEVLKGYELLGHNPEYVCCIYPTAPFLTKEVLHIAMNDLKRLQADTVMPVVKYSFPPQRCVVMKEQKLEAKWPEYTNSRSQDLEPYYHDCGQFYCLNVASFRKEKKIMMEYTVPFIQDEMKVQDIDTEEDWKIAELKYKVLHEEV